MTPDSMVLLLLVILGGVPISILFYYGAQVALRFVKRPAPAQVRGSGRTIADRIAYGPGAAGPDRLGVEGSQPAIIRVLTSQESGLPYASRSRRMRFDDGP